MSASNRINAKKRKAPETSASETKKMKVEEHEDEDELPADGTMTAVYENGSLLPDYQIVGGHDPTDEVLASSSHTILESIFHSLLQSGDLSNFAILKHFDSVNRKIQEEESWQPTHKPGRAVLWPQQADAKDKARQAADKEAAHTKATDKDKLLICEGCELESTEANNRVGICNYFGWHPGSYYHYTVFPWQYSTNIPMTDPPKINERKLPEGWSHRRAIRERKYKHSCCGQSATRNHISYDLGCMKYRHVGNDIRTATDRFLDAMARPSWSAFS